MQTRLKVLLGLIAALSAAGCDDAVTPETPALGGAGESCTARRDCEDGLSCLGRICTADAQANTTAGPEDAEPAIDETLGKKGESCTRRADCRPALSCFDQVCIGADDVPEGMTAPTRGDQGESCQARNDCGEGLACIGGRCTQHDFDLKVSAKECFRVECESTDDCCEDFVLNPAWVMSCDTYKLNCDAGDSFSCVNYESLCVCGLECEAESCVRVSTACVADLDCGGALVCEAGSCVECRATADCADPDATCISGACQEGCVRNEQCPRFHDCNAGECIEVGCRPDTNDCFLDTGNPRSECVDSECRVPCETDAECTTGLSACVDGTCTYVGCSDDSECRLILNIDNQFGTTQAVCRAPE